MSDKQTDLGLFNIPIPDFTPNPNFKRDAYQDAKDNKNAFSNWFGAVQTSGVRFPETITHPLSIDLQCSMMGELAETDLEKEVDQLVSVIAQFGEKHGFPLFIKTSFTSSKHYFEESCSLPSADRDVVMRHVYNLYEYQSMCSPHPFTPELIIREMIEVDPVFHAFANMPVTEEFRVFARDGKLEAYQPYWPVAAIENPSVTDWKERLATIKSPKAEDLKYMTEYAEKISKSLGGYWSVDFLRGKDGRLWLIDMADGNQSYVNKIDLVRVLDESSPEP